MAKKNLKKRFNDVIGEKGHEMGPALVSLILLGPIKRDIITDANMAILKERYFSFENFYYENIFPKIGEMFDNFAGGIYRFLGDMNELRCSFDYRTAEEIRERFRISYGVQQFRLDNVTKKGLFDDNENLYRHGNNVLHCFNSESGHMLSARYKETEEKIAKYNALYPRLDGIAKRNLLGFVVDVAENDSVSWGNYSYYEKGYGQPSMKMFLGDCFGVKITDMNQERAKAKMKELAKLKGKISFENFYSVKERFKDNRWKTARLRPGGIHYTIIDNKFPNYPVEIIFRGIRDELYNLYGPNRHDIYSEGGKRASGIFSDKNCNER